MLVTILLLILTLFVVPFISFYYGTPLNEIQSAMLYESSMIAVGVALYCFIVSEIAKTTAVDKPWSVVPFVMVGTTANTGFDPRMVLMSVLATIWAYDCCTTLFAGRILMEILGRKKITDGK